MAVSVTPVCTLTSTSSTTKQIFTVGAGNYTPSTFGDRLKSLTVNTGPTTAPGGTYIVIIYLYDGTNYTVLTEYTLVNAVNTNIALESPLFVNVVIPNGGGLYASIITALTSGATVQIVASVTANAA